MMKNTILLSFLFLFIYNINAQEGYFGKKRAFKFDAYFMPALRTQVNDDALFRGLSTTANLGYSWIIRDKRSMSVEYNYFKDYITSNDNNLNLLVKYYNQNSIGVAIKKFKKDWVAPIGYYTTHTIMINRNSISWNKDMSESSQWYSFKYGFGFGVQRVLYDMIIIDFGATFYLDSSLLGIATNEGDPLIGDAGLTELIYREKLRLKLGIGYMF